MPTITFDPEDYDLIRDAMMGVIDFVPTNAEIDAVIEFEPDLMAEAVKWTWGETETRTRLAVLLEYERATRETPPAT